MGSRLNRHLPESFRFESGPETGRRSLRPSTAGTTCCLRLVRTTQRPLAPALRLGPHAERQGPAPFGAEVRGRRKRSWNRPGAGSAPTMWSSSPMRGRPGDRHRHGAAPGPDRRLWTREAIEERKALIEGDTRPLGLRWRVVESLPMAEPIKLGEGDCSRSSKYRQSLRNLAACGVTIVCYNFMPVLDWTRTELEWEQPGGGRALRFNAHEFAAFDCFMLERPGAEAEHPPEVVARRAPGSRLVRRMTGGRCPRQQHGRAARRLRPLRHPAFRAGWSATAA